MHLLFVHIYHKVPYYRPPHFLILSKWSKHPTLIKTPGPLNFIKFLQESTRLSVLAKSELKLLCKVATLAKVPKRMQLDSYNGSTNWNLYPALHE